MAYIYQYHFKCKTLRHNISLKEYSEDIKLILVENFNINLKDSLVEEGYFEFKLYKTASQKSLQQMGRQLKKGLFNNIENAGFVRIKQTLYALVYESEHDKNNEIHIEFIDTNLLDNPKQYIKRAEEFFYKDGDKELLVEDYNVRNGIIKNYYIDVLDSYIDKNQLIEIFGNTGDKGCYLVKGYHRRYSYQEFIEKEHKTNLISIEKSFDLKYVENREQIDRYEDNKLDYLEILVCQKQDRKFKKVKEELILELPCARSIQALEGIGGKIDADKYKFQVHDVGQALATSLSIGEEPPFLYIDYGMPFGGNVGTKPLEVSMPTKPGVTIILTHVDKDHWFRVADEPKAYKCNWFIPNQCRKIQVNRVMAEILKSGGTVHEIENDIVFNGGRLTCGGVSRRKPSRQGKNTHETGISVRLESKDSFGNDFNTLIVGDQMYDYLDDSQLKNLDLMVASHHGGKYSWSTHDSVPEARTKDSMVVYSYGKNNTHKHPSKEEDYILANWRNEHHTKIEGSFKRTIYF